MTITFDRYMKKEAKYIFCQSCKFEQWDGYSTCQKCGAHVKENDGDETHEKTEDNQKPIPKNTEAEIAKLNEIISDLRQKGKQAVASRDKWKERAELAEREQNQQPKTNDYKFKQVKKMFSKMYHPDSLSGDRFEKLIKQEIFKEFWQVIEQIEK